MRPRFVASARTSLVARSVASVGSLVAAVATLTFNWTGVGLTHAAAAASLGVAAIAVHRRPIRAQLFARGVWLSALILGMLNVVYGWPSERATTLVVIAGVSSALAAAGKRGLGSDAVADSFAPVGFRSQLLGAMALAAADAASLLFYGLAWFEVAARVTTPLVLGTVAAASLVGLYRLRVWGLLLAVTTNIAVALTALTGVLAVPTPVRGVLAITAGIQIALLAPVLRKVFRSFRSAPSIEDAEPLASTARLRVATPVESAASEQLDAEELADVDPVRTSPRARSSA